MDLKQLFYVFTIAIFAPTLALAEPNLDQRLSTVVQKQISYTEVRSLSERDRFGTPGVIQLARQGDTKTLKKLAQYQKSGDFLLLTDSHNNNILHVAKDAQTIQELGVLVRKFYPPQKIQGVFSRLANARNAFGETPIYAQIKAGHADTFHLIYRDTTLKKKNEYATRLLARLNGMDKRTATQIRENICRDIQEENPPGGQSLLQAALAQVPQNPQMQVVVQKLAYSAPCK